MKRYMIILLLVGYILFNVINNVKANGQGMFIVDELPIGLGVGIVKVYDPIAKTDCYIVPSHGYLQCFQRQF